jgi:hypothetical protein
MHEGRVRMKRDEKAMKQEEEEEEEAMEQEEEVQEEEMQEEEVMERGEGRQQSVIQPTQAGEVPEPNPQGPGSATFPYVFALGQIRSAWSNLSAEREFAQATAQAQDTAGLTDLETLRAVVSERANRYLQRQICYRFTIQGLDTYILQPTDPADFDLLVEAISSSPQHVAVIVGVRGPIAPPEVCNGLMVPVVYVTTIWSFDRQALIQSIPRPESISEDEEQSFRAAAGELFDRVIQIADNAGATDEHRALNWTAVRNDGLYALAAEQYGRNFSLSRVEARPSPLSGVRKIMDVFLWFTNRETNVVEQYGARVDVGTDGGGSDGLFPSLVRQFTRTFEH